MSKIKLTPRLRDAVVNAIDWLTTNPDRHIRGTLAVKVVDKVSLPCNPNDPKADCFCVLGRISKELNLADYPSEDPEWQNFVQPKVDEDDIYFKNDSRDDRPDRPMFCGEDREAGNQKVFDYLRNTFDLEKTK